MNETTWHSAKKRCESQGRRLCSIKDLCSDVPSLIFKSLILPLGGDRLVPIADEYNDWTFVGNTSSSVCERHNQVSGPPAWGTNHSICKRPKKRLATFCSAIGSVICCEKRNGSLDEVKPIPVCSNLWCMLIGCCFFTGKYSQIIHLPILLNNGFMGCYFSITYVV